MKIAILKKLSLFVFLVAGTLIGAMAWSTVTLVEHHGEAHQAPRTGALVMLFAETELIKFDMEPTPAASVRVASRLLDAMGVVAKLSPTSSEGDLPLSSFLQSTGKIDFEQILGTPGGETKCGRGAMISCWVIAANMHQVFPTQDAADQLSLALKQNGIREKLHAAVINLEIRAINSQRFGMAYNSAHPILAWIDYASLCIANSIGLS